MREHPTPAPVELIEARDVRPTLAWSTIARAERLAALGAGRSPDHVLRRALAILERVHLEGGTA